MSNTPNYGLYLTDNDAISFLEWRKKINGTEDSNMTKIDAALKELAETPGTPGKDGKDGRDGTDGITPHIGDNGNWFIGSTDTGKPSRGANGKDGVDGKDGTDGIDGAPGNDGYSPVVTMSEVSGGTTITITDKTGTKTTTVKNGTNGTNGAPGKDGSDGKSAYESAQDGGYTGTEAAFNAALADVENKADKSVSAAATLTAAGWSDGEQTVNVSAVTSVSNGSLRIAQSATDEQFAAWCAAQPRVTAQATNTITIKAAGTVPTIDIPVEVLIV